jgi:hypothetical protein
VGGLSADRLIVLEGDHLSQRERTNPADRIAVKGAPHDSVEQPQKEKSA